MLKRPSSKMDNVVFGCSRVLHALDQFFHGVVLDVRHVPPDLRMAKHIIIGTRVDLLILGKGFRV